MLTTCFIFCYSFRRGFVDVDSPLRNFLLAYFLKNAS